MANCQMENHATMEAVSKARRLLAERQCAEAREWTDQMGENSIHAVTGGESIGAAGCEFWDSQLESSSLPTSDLSEEEWSWQQDAMSSVSKKIVSLADAAAPIALQLPQPARRAASDPAASDAYCTSKPRKMHSLRLSELRWDALAKKREHRRNLHLRGLPPKLCSVDAFKVLLKAKGLWEAVAGLRFLPRKAAQPGCAVLTAKDSMDVQRLAKYFHGRQFGAGAKVAVSFAAPECVNGLRPGQNPAKVQSSLDPIGIASSALGGVEALLISSVPAAGKAAWQLQHPGLIARSTSTDVLRMYQVACPIEGSCKEIVEDFSAATTMDDLALKGNTFLCASSASPSSSGCSSGDESEGRDGTVLFMPPPGLEGFAPHVAC